MTAKTETVKSLRARFEDIRERIRKATIRGNRDPAEIIVVGIGKTHPSAALQDALHAGITDLGENRVQEAEAKIAELGRHAARWHLVGHLQGNKARKAVRLFDVIHSVDSPELAQRLEHLCVEENIAVLSTLIQVDLAGEKTKTGITTRELPELVQAFQHLQRVRLIGLMTLPPFFEDPEAVRPFFQQLRDLRNELKRAGHFADGRGELSMGMTHDFEVAIEEGATMLRIGTAIFGERGK